MRIAEAQFIKAEALKISRQKLRYWREIKLFTPSTFTAKGHARYTYEDLKALKTIKLLREAGVKVSTIRICVKNIKEKFPSIKNPLTEIQLIVVGKDIVFIYEDKVYNAFSMQGYLLDFIKITEWAGELVNFTEFQSIMIENDADFFLEANLKAV